MTDQYFCEVCNTSVSGYENWESHKAGRKHKRKEMLTKKNAKDTNVHRCDICKVDLSGYESYMQHMNGKKHARMVKRTEIKEGLVKVQKEKKKKKIVPKRKPEYDNYSSREINSPDELDDIQNPSDDFISEDDSSGYDDDDDLIEEEEEVDVKNSKKNKIKISRKGRNIQSYYGNKQEFQVLMKKCHGEFSSSENDARKKIEEMRKKMEEMKKHYESRIKFLEQKNQELKNRLKQI